MSLITILTLISAISFLFFGFACFFNPVLKSEFVRYGFKSSRKLVGVLQLLGALGLFLGYVYSPILQAIAALGLSILMILGFSVRLNIRDSVIQSAPSLIYAVLNAVIFMMLFDIM